MMPFMIKLLITGLKKTWNMLNAARLALTGP